MSGLERFLAENKLRRENVFYAATKSLCDENGEPVLWELRHLSTAVCEGIKRDCMKRENDGGIVRYRTDTEKYMSRLLAASVVVPDLSSASLQDSYGVYTPEDLLKAMIDDPGEYAAFADYIYGMLGFKPFAERVAQAKN